jgi:hypothetical protein
MLKTQIRSTKPYIPALYFILTGLEGLGILTWLNTKSATVTRAEDWVATRSITLISLAWLISATALVIFGLFLLLHNKTVQNFYNRVQSSLVGDYPSLRRLMLLLCIIFLLFTSAMILIWGASNAVIKFFTEPFTVWFYLAFLQFIFLIIFGIVLPSGSGDKKAFLISIAIIAAIWLLIVVTRIGLNPDDRYWNVAGVPVLLNQLVLIIFLVLLADLILDKIRARTGGHTLGVWLDVVICMLLWAGAAWLWNQAPFSKSFFAEGTYPPNQDFYPYSDAALTDLGGQYMLIGERLEYPYFTEKPLYTFSLGLLHQFVGQNYLTTTTWQIVCFAIFPVILYLLGKEFYHRLFGLSLGLFAVVKEYNAIFSSFKISVSNSRLYLSEFPTMILLALLALILLKWFKKPQKQSPWIIISGAVLGFALMVRTNVLVLVPFVMLMALFVYKFQWKHIWSAWGIFILGFTLAIAPWTAYNRIEYGIDPFSYKIQSVIQTRFLHVPQSPAPTGLPVNDPILLGMRTPQTSESPRVAPRLVNTARLKLPNNAAEIVAGHFLNNEIKALFVIPFQLYPLELTPVLNQLYWEEPVTWQGEMPLSAGLAFAANLTLIGLGISAAWQKTRWAGLIPLLINVGYYLSNALGRTSGSRYLLPADWTLYFYFLFGLAVLWRSLMLKMSAAEQVEPNPVIEQSASHHEWRGTLIAGLVILLLSSLIPLINISYPKLYAEQNEERTMAALYQSAIFAQQPELVDQVSDLIDQENGMVFTGRMLYPRYRDFAHREAIGLFLTVLQPELTEVFFHFDEDDLTEMLPGLDVIIVGCKKDGYIEGFLGYIPEQGLTLRSNVPYSAGYCQR